MKYLLIAEKPSLMRTISKVYNANRNTLRDMDITFMAQAGHILGQKMPDEINPVLKKWSLDNLPLQVDTQYKVLQSNLIRQIKAEIESGNYDAIIHAGDPDQEGEILVRETLQYLRNNLPVYRYWTNDLNDPAVLQALRNVPNNPDSRYDNLAAAGFLRQKLDYHYGLNLTEAMTLKSGTLLRMGRVKAPIIAAIVEREKEIENFVPSSTYERAFIYERDGKTYQFVDESEIFDTMDALEGSLTGEGKHIPKEATVTDVKAVNKTQKAPKLYKLSTLQSDAYAAYHIPASTTLSTLQTLYEQGYTSYPRSSCEYISSDTPVEAIYNRVSRLFPQALEAGYRGARAITADKTYCNNKAIASEGHTGIIPTGKMPNMADLSDLEQKIYHLVCARFVAMCSNERQYHQEIYTAKDENGYAYQYKGNKDIDLGFVKILKPKQEMTDTLLIVQKGEELNPIVFVPKEIEKKCPSRFNEGSLIKFLSNPIDYKDEGGHKVKYAIGTEATRAGIIKQCVENQYFSVSKGVYTPTKLARTTYEDYKTLDVFQIQTSAKWEADFISIRDGEKRMEDVQTALMQSLYQSIANIKDMTVSKVASPKMEKKEICDCPCCNGKIIENTKAFSCSNWKEGCMATIWKSSLGTSFTKTDVKKLFAGETVSKKCKSKAGKSYTVNMAYDFHQQKVVWAKNLEQDYER